MNKYVKALYFILLSLSFTDALMTIYAFYTYPGLAEETNDVTLNLMGIFGLYPGLLVSLSIKIAAIIFIFKLINGDINFKIKDKDVLKFTEREVNLIGFWVFLWGIAWTGFTVYMNSIVLTQLRNFVLLYG